MPTLLIVDDARTDRVRVTGIASRWLNCAVMEAANGDEAMEKIRAHHPDIVLTDLHMPEMDGLQLVAAVKEDFPQIPVVLMTAKGSEDIAAQALRAGAASYVPKTRLATDLVETLNRVYTAALVADKQFRLMHYATETMTNFVLPNDTIQLKAAVEHILNMLRCIPLGDQAERLRVGIALQEALDNACYYGNLGMDSQVAKNSEEFFALARKRSHQEPWLHRRVNLRAHINREQAVFVITDDGDGFDTSIASQPDDTDIRGRGFTLIQSIMDEVRFNKQGNEITLVRNAVTFGDELDDEDEDDDPQDD